MEASDYVEPEVSDHNQAVAVLMSMVYNFRSFTLSSHIFLQCVFHSGQDLGAGGPGPRPPTNRFGFISR